MGFFEIDYSNYFPRLASKSHSSNLYLLSRITDVSHQHTTYLNIEKILYEPVKKVFQFNGKYFW
jgi:hypothetical protein